MWHACCAIGCFALPRVLVAQLHASVSLYTTAALDLAYHHHSELCHTACGCSGFKQRYEVFVCTKGEPPYAHEVWRLLDPGYHLIPAGELHSRIVSVDKTQVLQPADVVRSLSGCVSWLFTNLRSLYHTDSCRGSPLIIAPCMSDVQIAESGLEKRYMCSRKQAHG